MLLNVKIAPFNLKKIHLVDYLAFHRKNTIKVHVRTMILR